MITNGLDKESMFWVGIMLGYIVHWIFNFGFIGFCVIAGIALIDLFVINRNKKPTEEN